MISPSLESALQYDPRDPRNKPPGFFKEPKLESYSQNKIKPSLRPGRSVSARVFPNGEFGVGFVPQRGISAQDRRYERERRDSWDNAEMVADVQISPDGEQMYYTRTLVPQLPDPKLGTGTELSQATRKYGSKGITAHGRKMLRNAGYIFDVVAKSGGGYLPQMGTLTIPSLEPERMREICVHWGDIVKRFFQECRRRYARFGKTFDYASCTEIQPGRWNDRREVGLHIHFIFIAFRLNRKVWSLPDQWVRAVWRRVLVRYVGEAGVPANINYRREGVRDSSAAYLAKYASKGADFIAEVSTELGPEALPSQWWSINRRVRDCIRRHTILSTGHQADLLLCICREGMEEYLLYSREVVLDTGCTEYAKSIGCPEKILLGYGGRLSPDGRRLFTWEGYYGSIIRFMSLTVDKSRCN